MTFVVMVVVVLFGVGGLLAAAAHAAAALLGLLLTGAAGGAAAGAVGLGGATALELGLGDPAHDDRDVAAALADARGAATGPGAHAAQRLALVGEARRDEQVLGDLVVVVGGVGDGRREHLADHDGGVTLGEAQDLVGRGDVLAADEIEHDAGLVRREADVTRHGARAGTLVGLARGRDVDLADGAGRAHRRPPRSWPAWNRNVRVGANSPSL